MHEMTLMESVRSIVDQAHRQHGFTRVKRVVLELGDLAGVQMEALTFCFDVVMKGGPAEVAVLEIERLEGRAWCPTCATEVAITSRLDPCPTCSGMPGKVTQGLEMRVKGLDVV